MSGVLKAVVKVFKVIAIVAAVAVIAAAVVVTAGAAGVLGTTFATAAAGASAAGAGAVAAGTAGLMATVGIGATTTLGTILGGAMVYAGYGAATGAIVAAATGQNILKGAMSGAAVGAVTGGVLGAAGAGPFKVAATVPPQAPGLVPDATTAPAAGIGGDAVAPATQAAAPAATQVGAELGNRDFQLALLNAAKPAAPTLFQTAAPIIGSTIAGLGAGLGGMAQAQAAKETQANTTATIADNYKSFVPGLMQTNTYAAPTTLPTPATRFATNFSYQYDPAQGMVVKTPVAAG